MAQESLWIGQTALAHLAEESPNNITAELLREQAETCQTKFNALVSKLPAYFEESVVSLWKVEHSRFEAWVRSIPSDERLQGLLNNLLRMSSPSHKTQPIFRTMKLMDYFVNSTISIVGISTPISLANTGAHGIPAPSRPGTVLAEDYCLLVRGHISTLITLLEELFTFTEGITKSPRDEALTKYLAALDKHRLITKLPHATLELVQRVAANISERRITLTLRHERARDGVRPATRPTPAGCLPRPTRAKDLPPNGPITFDCPYCLTTVTVRDRFAWNEHLYTDIQPYVCIFADCDTPLRRWSSRQGWLNHIVSRHGSKQEDPHRDAEGEQRSPAAFLAKNTCPFCDLGVEDLKLAPPCVGMAWHIEFHLEELSQMIFVGPVEKIKDYDPVVPARLRSGRPGNPLLWALMDC
ncbi:uncharacterized protein DSM5745_05976 [Aspergillus mulundensis]|uniref:Oxidoreductase acuF-like C2H2 type zinc-finger domain-containing protein n=1 Tax=Aspergillus mulundensis TaxID=1810919 RepID=A0A3D8RZ40_9EURO|nr:hypothetical protein DSM5745_05976 [Aspergillus mulundensis]RDW79124.1 hypothetical protein DSM5745_05976 [Aspergillus mulundensis]